MKDYIIVMADIIDSRKTEQKILMSNFKNVTNTINKVHEGELLSPMTITLGDEFQGLVNDLTGAVNLIFTLEELIVSKNVGFKLRYVVIEGGIDTPINKQIAYGMLGEGLTRAREALQQYKNTNFRCNFQLRHKRLSSALEDSMLVWQRIIDDWKVKKDHELITKFITLRDYKKVAADLGKSRSQIWKREKSLRIEEYFSIKEVIRYIAGEHL